MENNLTLKKKKSELNASSKEIAFLSYHHDMLADCAIVEQNDEIVFSFDTEGLKNCSESCNLGNEKYRFLANCANLLALYKELDFTLNPDNLMFDLNLNPVILIRDKQTDKTESDFFHMYQALCGAVINPKYGYADYEKGGTDLFGKSNQLKKIASLETVADLKDYLIRTYSVLQETEQNIKVKVSKKNYSVLKVLVALLVVLALAGGTFALFAYVYTIPYQNTLIKADNAFFKGNYVEVQNTLNGFDIDQLPVAQKYVLSKSIVYTEGMNKEEREGALNSITTDRKDIMDYWIYIGRLDYDNAVDRAQRIGKDRLLLYAYIKQRDSLMDNTAISGEEKTTKLKELEEKISNLEKTVDQENKLIEKESAQQDETTTVPETNGEE